MRLPWLIALVLTGCAVPPPNYADTGPYHITNYVPSPLEPENCGSPYAFELCIALPPRRPSVHIEQLDNLPGSVPVDDMPTVIANKP
jgi:hypothetical protein